jgi:hypothetical protein
MDRFEGIESLSKPLSSQMRKSSRTSLIKETPKQHEMLQVDQDTIPSTPSPAGSPEHAMILPTPDQSPQVTVQDSDVEAEAGTERRHYNAQQTVGGGFGHHVRRLFHVITFVSFPFAYYLIGSNYALPNFSKERYASIMVLGVMIAEAFRLWKGLITFGLREYERNQVSALAWGAVSTLLVVLAAPQAGSSWNQQGYLSFPIIWGVGIVDPLIGEMKANGLIGRWFNNGDGLSVRARCVVATMVVWAIWIATGFILRVFADWWFILIIGPVVVAAEYPSLHVIDDNGMMQLVPLSMTFIFRPFFSPLFL